MKDELNDILEILHFMQENMATKQDLERFATKEDLKLLEKSMELRFAEFRSDVVTHIDGFAQQNIRFDHELVAMQSKYNRLEDRVDVLEQKV